MYEKVQSFVVELGDPIVVGLIVGWQNLSDEWIDEVRSYLEADPNIIAVIPGSGVNPFKYLKDNELISKIPQPSEPKPEPEPEPEEPYSPIPDTPTIPETTTETSSNMMMIIGVILIALLFFMK